MEESRFEGQFNRLSGRLVEIDPGNLVELSELIDSVQHLGKASPCPGLTSPLFEIVTGCLTAMLRHTGDGDCSRIVSEGIDLAHLCFRESEAGAELPGYLADAVKAFIEANGSARRETQLHDQETPPFEGRAPRADIAGSIRTREPGDAPSFSDRKAVEILNVFLHESDERLSSAQSLILELELELGEGETDRLNRLFRIFHTIKGEAGFLNLVEIGSLAHQVENVLDHLRQAGTKIDTGIIDLLLESIDCMTGLIAAVVEGSEEKMERTVSDLLDRMYRRVHADRPPVGEMMVREGLIGKGQVREILKRQRETGYRKRFGELSVEQNLVDREDLEAVLREQQRIAASGAPGGKAVRHVDERADDRLVTVKASSIRNLIDMAGELSISLTRLDETNRDVIAARKISRVLQGAVMQLGTVSIGTLFMKMKRIVRDTSRQLNRDVELVLSGEDLEVDRDLVDSLGEPLMHLLRNAVAHGIENAAEREAAGKPASGTVLLKAERRGHQVVISVRDDGQGLREDVILKKAVEKNLVSAEQSAAMNREAAWELIFAPGFSTAGAVDAVSGRGVGMDVVKHYVASRRGTVRLSSEKGAYTEISMVFPINMAIIEGMITRLGNQYFVIPVMSIVETIELKPDMFHDVREDVKIISVRGRTIPVIDLATCFGLPASNGNGRIVSVIVEAREAQFALLVEEIIAKREIVIKPLGSLFGTIRGIASGTILRKGRIGLVLDINEIVAGAEKRV